MIVAGSRTGAGTNAAPLLLATFLWPALSGCPAAGERPSPAAAARPDGGSAAAADALAPADQGPAEPGAGDAAAGDLGGPAPDGGAALDGGAAPDQGFDDQGLRADQGSGELPALLWPPRLAVRDGRLVDEAGRLVRLRGVSATNSAKRGPEHAYWEEPGDWAELAGMGVTLVRLLVFWDGLEPEPDRIDQGYVQRVRREAEEVAAAGLLLLVDMHQDLFCQRYGNGAPLWACPDDIPYQPLEPWFLNYASAAVTAAFDRFWTDAELRGHLVRAWAELGRALADLEAVVAFEPINEPWPGSFPPESFEPLQLSGFYSEVIAGLDRAAPGRLYVLEPAVTRQISGRTWLALPPRADLVYAPHYYHPRVESGQGYTEADRPALLEELERIRSDGQRLGLPILLGEYGGQSSCPGFADYLEQLEQELEAEGISSSLWEHARDARGFGLLDTEGQVKQEMRAFLRPYALRVPGRRVVERYAAAQGCYRAFFEGDPAVPGPLELVLPRRLAGGELILRSQSDPAAAASPRLSAERTRLVLPYPARGGIRDLEVCGLATP